MFNNTIGNQVIKLKSVDSTNNYAAKLLKQTKIPFGTVIMARYQTDGKGQINGLWDAEEDSNLLMSVILDTEFLTIEKVFFLSKVVALSLIGSLNQFGIKASIKWPNDIIVNRKKIAGVLIENQWFGHQLSSSVIGIGLNVNQVVFPKSFNATSLKLITSRLFVVEDVLKVVCHYLNQFYKLLIDLKFQKIDLAYHEFLINYNELANFKEENEIFTAKVNGVNELGELVLQLNDGQVKFYKLKQITQLL
tara:strand:+ start:9424 stop:10170 length:747 start_codon:yes stop_codon:yes gene_type:complete